MRKGLALLAAMLVLVAACGSAAPAGGQTTTAPAGPTKGGDLVVVTGHEPQTLDHHLATGVYDGYMSFTLSNGLVRTKPDGTIEPALAERWEIPDPMTYIFHLRKGVTFHDGTKVDAAAVKFNFDRLFDPATKSSRAQPRLGALKNVTVIDDSTVKVTTKFPFGPFLGSLAIEPIAVIESPDAMKKAGVADYGTRPVGSGAFIFQEWVQGDRVVFKANDKYWGGRPNIDTLTFKIVKDPSTRLSLLQTGAAHFAVELNPPDFINLQSSKEIQTTAAPFDNTLFIEMSNIQAPFDNPLVRQAVCYAIDKEAIRKTVLQGLAKDGYGILPTTTWAKNTEAERYSYNEAKAKDLLNRAGLPNGFTTTFWHPTGRYSGDAQVAQAVQGYLRKVGIQAELKTGDLTSWASAMRGTAPDKPGAPMYMRGWGVSGDPDSQIYVLYHSKNWGLAGNYARYKNTKVDDLLEKARLETTQEARKNLYKEAEAQITKDAAACTLYDNVRLLAYTKKLHDVRIGPLEYQFFETAWLDR